MYNLKKNMKSKNFLHVLLVSLGLMLVSMSCCCRIHVNDIQDKIVSVKDGNTIMLSSGLTVHLNGIRSNSTFCREQLNKYVGEEVSLLLDSNEPNTTISDFEEEVWAYVHLVKTGEELNYNLLALAGEDAFDSSNCDDRNEDYRRVVCTDCTPPMSEPELCAKMTAASMLVYAGDSYGQNAWIGTAFFIGKDGLALTNNHVLNHQTDGYVYLSDSYGNVDVTQPFKVKRIVYTDTQYDYTIFYVDLDPTSLSRLVNLDLAKKESSFQRGEKIGVVGNPAPGSNILEMSYAMGEIAAFRVGEGKVQVSASITHGFSGGPAANNRGQVIGILQSMYEELGNLNFAVDIRIVRKKLDELNLPYGGK